MHAPDVEDDVPVQPLIESEALLLCGLMWAGTHHPASDEVCRVLQPGDFYDPHYGALFGVIAQRRSAGRPVDAGSLRSALTEMGDRAPLPRASVHRVLLEVAMLRVVPELVTDYADQVLGYSYRRQFQAMAAALTHAGVSLPEGELFAALVEHGRAQRAAWERRQTFRRRDVEKPTTM